MGSLEAHQRRALPLVIPQPERRRVSPRKPRQRNVRQLPSWCAYGAVGRAELKVQVARVERHGLRAVDPRGGRAFHPDGIARRCTPRALGFGGDDVRASGHSAAPHPPRAIAMPLAEHQGLVSACQGTHLNGHGGPRGHPRHPAGDDWCPWGQLFGPHGQPMEQFGKTGRRTRDELSWQGGIASAWWRVVFRR